MNLTQLKALFVKAGAIKLYAKPLAENDNSKNQVYFGPDFQALNLFPNDGVVPDSSPKNPIFKAKLHFGWLTESGTVVDAPCAQLILYPQYPEVRFSGFLKGCVAPPSSLMVGRIIGRVLFLGVTDDGRVLGFVVGLDSEIAAEVRSHGLTAPAGVFIELSLPTVPDESDSRSGLLAELHRISQLGWIDSKQLDSDGVLKPCLAPQCGGFTLEAELGIPKNSIADADYLGWEVKQHSVTNFTRPDSGAAITLMTPEPTSGFYKEQGVEAFIRKYGYPDRNDKPDRLNFGGIHRVGERHVLTGLTMRFFGYDFLKEKITDTSGAIALIDDTGDVAAAWAFSGLLAHWSRKHTRAVYVPSMRRTEPHWQYAYGARVRLAQRTDGLRLLKAMATGAVYYDPGIKLEQASSAKPVSKKRSQFRVASKHISALYETVETVEV